MAEHRDKVIVLDNCALDLLGQRLALGRLVQSQIAFVFGIEVVDDLNAILRRKQIAPPPDSLLQGAYNAMIASLKANTGAAVNRDYVEGQVEYQKGNDALFRYEIQYGTDPDLKKFAQRTLPKIDDHLQRALRLAKSEQLAKASSH